MSKTVFAAIEVAKPIQTDRKHPPHLHRTLDHRNNQLIRINQPHHTQRSVTTTTTG